MRADSWSIVRIRSVWSTESGDAGMDSLMSGSSDLILGYCWKIPRVLGGKIVRQEDGHFDVCIKCRGGGQYCCTTGCRDTSGGAGRGVNWSAPVCRYLYISTYLDLDNCSQIYIDSPWPAAEKISSCHPRVMAEVGHKYCNMIYPLVTDKTKIPQPPLPHSGKPHKH